jgi:hypothetical protein
MQSMETIQESFFFDLTVERLNGDKHRSTKIMYIVTILLFKL